MRVNKEALKEVGRYSKEVREREGRSAQFMADAMKKDVSNIYRFERGDHKNPMGYLVPYLLIDSQGDYMDNIQEILGKREVKNG